MPSNKGRERELPASDINVLHLPENALNSISGIAFEEGQNSVKKSETAKREDPSLEGATLSPNALAYAEDINNLRCRGL